MRRHRARAVAMMMAAAALVSVAGALTAGAHHLTPEEVVARLGTADARDAFDITAVERAATLPRLLLVRVGPGWASVSSVRRVAAAEQWYQLWRDAMPNGVVGIVDVTDRSLVNFDPTGRATLRDSIPVSPSR